VFFKWAHDLGVENCQLVEEKKEVERRFGWLFLEGEG
jgi:hypothetical protein